MAKKSKEDSRFIVDLEDRTTWIDVFSKMDSDELSDVCGILSNFLVIPEWFTIDYFEMADGETASQEVFEEFMESARGNLSRNIRNCMSEDWDEWRRDNYPDYEDDEEDDEDDYDYGAPDGDNDLDDLFDELNS